jgi:hypothetical protein
MTNLLKYDSESEWHLKSPIATSLKRLLWLTGGIGVAGMTCVVVLGLALAVSDTTCDKPFYYYPGSTLIEKSGATHTYTSNSSFNKVYDFFDNKLQCDNNRCEGVSENGLSYVVEFAPQDRTPTQYTVEITGRCGW